MSKNWNYRSGDWWLYCDSCNRKIKASHSRHRWDGFIVCDSCFEHRHPQDLIRTKIDKQSVPFSRPKTVDTFSSTYLDGTPVVWYGNTLSCSNTGTSSISGFAISGCSISGKQLHGTL